MSSRIFVPFDNNPVNTFVTTTDYTVPTGKFAKVICNIQHAVLLLNNKVIDYEISAPDAFSISDGGSQSTSLILMDTSIRYGKYYVSMSNSHYNNNRYCQLRHYRNGNLIWTSSNVRDFNGATNGSSSAYRTIEKGDQFYRFMSGSNDSGSFTCVFYSDPVGTSNYIRNTKVYELWLKEGDVISLQNPIGNTNVQTTGDGFDTIASLTVQEYNKVS
jgi:hypothetical protein